MYSARFGVRIGSDTTQRLGDCVFLSSVHHGNPEDRPSSRLSEHASSSSPVLSKHPFDEARVVKLGVIKLVIRTLPPQGGTG